MGIDPYPADLFDVNTTIADIRATFGGTDGSDIRKLPPKQTSPTMPVGVMYSWRAGSWASVSWAVPSFAEMQDATGRLQLYFRRDDLCPGEDKTLYNTVFKKLLDIGDIIGIRGYIFTTKTGELSVYVREFNILNKALAALAGG